MSTKVAAKAINIEKPVENSVHVPAPSQVFGKIMDTLYSWQERSRLRSQLRGLDDHFLKDMGIGKADAYDEYSKPFWKK